MAIKKSVVEKYGQILFGDQRFQNSPETNTVTENEAYNRISDFIWDDFGPNIQSNTSKLFATLIRIKENNRYKDVLMPDNYNYLYRGISFTLNNTESLNSAIKLFKSFKLTEKTVGGLFGDYVYGCSYKPIHKIESWTTNKLLAKEYALSSINFLPDFGVVFRSTPTKKEMLFNTSFTNKLAMALHDKKEDEIIRVSSNPLNCKAKIFGDKNTIMAFLYEERII